MSRSGAGHPALGVGEAVTAAALWGTSGIFSVHLFRMGVTPGAVALLRPLMALAVLVALVGVLRPRWLRIDRRGLLFLLTAGGAAAALFQISYQLSIDAVGVPSTVAMVFLAPALVVAAAGPLLGEWPTRRRVLLAALVAAGVWLSVLGADEVAASFGTTGIAWGLAAGVAYAGYTLVGRYASPRWGPAQTMIYSTAGSCVVLAGAVPAVTGPVALPGSGAAWAVLAAYAVVTITVAQLLFYDALARTEASRVSIAAAAEPVVAALLATLLLGQGLAPLGWAGLALVVAGVAGVSVRTRRRTAP